ncbi:hypothetical protein [Peribacillus frigoritolerans]|uniref:hypothetical protein n=1 Tax=Peribacillus frigoritolerans TaxID=450367 RepID=UPI0022806993|nr:hypothetical protein [Peribacillus frigoritolerans]MCY8938087.1 hypothetical protein [Peribacillus frigoritolerans]
MKDYRSSLPNGLGEKGVLIMSNAKYKFYYVNGETEELETNQPYTDDLKSSLRVKLTHNPTWFQVGETHINLTNVIRVEVVGDQDRQRLNLSKLRLKP